MWYQITKSLPCCTGAQLLRLHFTVTDGLFFPLGSANRPLFHLSSFTGYSVCLFYTLSPHKITSLLVFPSLSSITSISLFLFLQNYFKRLTIWPHLLALSWTYFFTLLSVLNNILTFNHHPPFSKSHVRHSGYHKEQDRLILCPHDDLIIVEKADTPRAII